MSTYILIGTILIAMMSMPALGIWAPVLWKEIPEHTRDIILIVLSGIVVGSLIVASMALKAANKPGDEKAERQNQQPRNHPVWIPKKDR